MSTPRRVLLADDHAIVRFGLRAMIDGQPDLRVVAEAETGPEAVVLYCEHRPDITVVDLLLPGLDGAVVCEEIHKVAPRARILVVSGSSGSEHIHRAFRAGAMGYLLKDSPPSAILKGIRDVAAGIRVVPPAIAAELAERAYQGDLSPRELDVLRAMAEGRNNRQIAGYLTVSEATVKTHITHILEKLGVEDRTQAVLAAVRRGIVPAP